ncbi:MAG: hypothetical protein GYA33_13505 [Thermogutta sp.]|nr:hypothetical protein [Thermogutta sp.]
MKVFLAGIMQGSLTEKGLHDQDYRQLLRQALARTFPHAEIYDPLADHRNSLDYEPKTGRDVFFHHNRMCREVDLLVAYVPQASMGTAIEMWEAHQHGAAVVSISPMRHNWAVKFLSHAIYPDVPAFLAALESGEIARLVRRVRSSSPVLETD